jgi:hypothetical protein
MLVAPASPYGVPEVGLGLRPAAISVTMRPSMIADVSLRLLYLILDRFLSWPVLLGRTSSAKDVELHRR